MVLWEYTFMMKGWIKTTVELPDDLFIATKKRAAELHRPMRDLIVCGLRLQLHAPAAPSAKPRSRGIRWVVVAGGLPPGIDLSDRTSMYEGLLEMRR